MTTAQPLPDRFEILATRRGKPSDPCFCAVAEAAKEALGVAYVAVWRPDDLRRNYLDGTYYVEVLGGDYPGLGLPDGVDLLVRAAGRITVLASYVSTEPDELRDWVEVFDGDRCEDRAPLVEVDDKGYPTPRRFTFVKLPAVSR